MQRTRFAPRLRQAAQALLLALTLSADALAIDLAGTLPAEEGWQTLVPGPDWILRRAPLPSRRRAHGIAPVAASGPADASGAPSVPVAFADGKAGSDDAGTAPAPVELAGAATTGGYVGMAGAPSMLEPDAVALQRRDGAVQIRYRVLAAGDGEHPRADAAFDAGHAWVRTSARRLDGAAVGPQRMADDRGQGTRVQRLAWNEMPGELATAVRRMPYHARWEVLVTHPVVTTGKASFHVPRTRAQIVDVERLPPASEDGIRE